MPKRKDQEYLDWLSYQPSWLDRAYSETDDTGAQRNIPCHVRRAGKAGTAYKPLFCAVPMTDAQHRLQSTKGELACIEKYARKILPKDVDSSWDGVRWAKTLFDQAATYYKNKWRKLCR